MTAKTDANKVVLHRVFLVNLKTNQRWEHEKSPWTPEKNGRRRAAVGNAVRELREKHGHPMYDVVVVEQEGP